MSRVLVSGSIAYDRIMVFPGYFKDHFLPDKLHNINVSFQVDTVAENFGGCAGNIAYNLSLMDVESSIIAVGGSDFERYAAHLKKLKTTSESVRIEKNAPTSSAYVMTDKADNQIAAFSMGAGKTTYSPLPKETDVGCAIIAPGNHDDMRRLPRHYRDNNIPYFYDPGQAMTGLSADDLRDGIDGAEGLFGNDYEFTLISKITGLEEQALLERTKVLIVTYGPEGCRVVTRAGDTKLPAVPVAKVVDPTGAGDGLRAGYVAAYLKGQSPIVAARLGSTVAAYAVEKYGTQNHTFTIDELRKRYESAHAETFPL